MPDPRYRKGVFVGSRRNNSFIDSPFAYGWLMVDWSEYFRIPIFGFGNYRMIKNQYGPGWLIGNKTDPGTLQFSRKSLQAITDEICKS